jgi:hypothetical protein
MANRRMISRDVADTSFFTDMPASAQALYFRLVLEADDEGFVASVRTAQFKSNASIDDLKILLGKRFVLPMKEGVVVIKHWFQENYIAPNHFKRTQWTELEEKLFVKVDGSYTDDPSKGKPFKNLISDQGLNQAYKTPVEIEKKTDADILLTNSQPKSVEVSVVDSKENEGKSKEESVKDTDNGGMNKSAYAQKLLQADLIQDRDSLIALLPDSIPEGILNLAEASMRKGEYESNLKKFASFMEKL